MVKVYGVFDLDGILYNHKGMHAGFLKEVFSGDEIALKYIRGFEASPYVYIYDYLVNDSGEEKDYFLGVAKNVFSLNGASDNSLAKEFFYRSLREFSDTPYFSEGGVIPELVNANRRIVERARRLGVDYEGVVDTSRAPGMNDVDWLYNDCHKRTLDWLSRSGSLISRVFYHKTFDKAKVLDELSDGFVAFMMEDHSHSLEGFLERGVPCVLVNSTGKEDSYADFLRESYPRDMFVFDNHEDGGVMAEKLFEAAVNKYL